ncbi:MAG TPA: 1,4-alpha-glucan branching protein GlgB [Kofleriaceae bacterium]|nr:1,4-alpha-glucan branching protein GlgB [Kofleriaceae bacterium]
MSAPGYQLTADDLYLFGEGTHYRLQDKLGAHPGVHHGASGVHFAVWAPNAAAVAVIGDFNGWNGSSHRLHGVQSSGIWAGFVPGAVRGQCYKYRIESHVGGYTVDKADPVGARAELPPRTASVIADLDYEWRDQRWMADRGRRLGHDAPVSIYEVHLGSWRRGDGDRFLSYRELAPALADYVADLGFTHVELMPITEHPFYGSWGYQVTGYFAPTARYGSPQDLMFLVDTLHQRGIGVILDWVPAHFPTDEHGLGFFDGTHLYEHADPRQGFHPDWTSLIYNYGRAEVRSFLISSALFWLERYHVDALRVDGVASMLYLDYSRQEGEWIANEDGSRENRDAIAFLQQLNTAFYRLHPDAHMIAEESTAWSGVSRPVSAGGLGFGYKWDLGWMHDTLSYLARDPVHRAHHHDELTFRAIYAFSENFVLPLSHDEVVHGKGSLLSKMPGDDWQQRANLRLLFGYQFAQPGKKLVFMGCELAARREWQHEASLDWGALEAPGPAGVQRWVRDLNRLYAATPALYRRDTDPGGFAWIAADDRAASVLSFLRWGGEGDPGPVCAVFNFTPIPRPGYRVGLPRAGTWCEVLNSDAEMYGGAGHGNYGRVEAVHEAWNGQPCSAELHLPPLSCVFFQAEEAPS